MRSLIFTAAIGFLFLGLPLAHEGNTPGLKIVMRHTIGGGSGEQTVYLQLDRKRTERRPWSGVEKRWFWSSGLVYGPRLATILRCDLGQQFDLNLDARQYSVSPYPPTSFSREEREARGQEVQYLGSGNPTLRIERTTVDTGERKEMFGHTARHVITTEKQIPLEDSKTTAQERIIDGWYIDLDTSVSCEPGHGKKQGLSYAYAAFGLFTGRLEDMRMERVEFVAHGAQETGFALETKTTSSLTDEARSSRPKDRDSKIEMRVIQLVEGPLEPALFSVPPEFHQVKTIDRSPPADLPDELLAAWKEFKSSLRSLFE